MIFIEYGENSGGRRRGHSSWMLSTASRRVLCSSSERSNEHEDLRIS